MPNDVEVVEVLPRPIAAVSEQVKQAELSRRIQGLLGEVWEHLRARGITTTGHNIALYLGIERAPEGPIMNCLFGVEVQGDVPSTARVVLASTPGGRAAHVAYYGDYAGLGAAHRAIQDWSATIGEALVGPFWEVYGDWTDDPSQLRTDVYYLLFNYGR